ncbi:MAG: hypothetical protein QOD11_1900 [Bradyrhizobium sp.]|jgi:hypothetical protein|nr:hypothetical protein [Bradyrhizobium sp.]
MSAKKTHCGQVAVTISARKFAFDSGIRDLTGSSIVDADLVCTTGVVTIEVVALLPNVHFARQRSFAFEAKGRRAASRLFASAEVVQPIAEIYRVCTENLSSGVVVVKPAKNGA